MRDDKDIQYWVPFFYANMAESTTTSEATSGGSKQQPRAQLYQKFEPLANQAIEVIKKCMESRNENIAMGAAKIVLERTVPAIKAIELTGNNGDPIKFNIISGSDYVSAISKLTTASATGSFGRSTEVQSVNLASTGTQDNNSDKSISEVVPTQD